MARIKIKDLPENMNISREELKRIRGGSSLVEEPLATELEGDLLNVHYSETEQDIGVDVHTGMVSSVMKTKHDTAKAAINNIR